ncbi:universal stress protein [Arthrobacter sp. D5-1]|uniref:universal stress protein n=1 Tax=Arthrobacter sp. D5-1 TaxID=1477518 RepID=UPI001A99320F|nr:universal stress protein [Arthrobacter sp. D5-1]QSZ48699.1 universal stress protein [Arthrobacter sp. D5-1]
MKKQILVALDGSRAGSFVADWAAARANSLDLGLALVNVVPGEWAYPRENDHQLAVSRAEDLLNSEAQRLAAAFPNVGMTTQRLSGEPAATIASLSPAYSMVVVGTDRGPGTEGQGYGSVSFQVAVTSKSDVAVVPGPARDQRSGVVVGVDGSAESLDALDRGAREAQRLNDELIIVHATGPGVGPAEGGNVLSAAVQQVNHRFPSVVVKEVLDTSSSPGEALIAAAREAQLLVMGCKGRGGLSVLLGSVAQHVLLHVQCPIILTRP